MPAADILEGLGGLQKVVVRAGAPAGGGGASAEVYLHGSTVTGWEVNGEQLIFLSPSAVFAPPKAIRGGVPVCFPQFGLLGPLKTQHGFARNRLWRVALAEEGRVCLELTSDEETLKEWPHPFKLTLEVSVQPTGALHQVLRVQNTGSEQLEFTCALHTYFKVSDVGNATVIGLKGVRYWDNAKGEEATDTADAVLFPGEVDRAYIGAPDTLKLTDSGRSAVLMVHKRGFQDAVVWSPGQDKAAGMSDLGDWRGFVCVEVAQARSGAVVLAPGDSWEGSTTAEYDTLGES